mgnify:CR=1 FL=1
MINYSITIFKGGDIQQAFVRTEIESNLNINNSQEVLDYITDFLGLEDNTLNQAIYSRFGRCVTFVIDDEYEVLFTWEVFQ